MSTIMLLPIVYVAAVLEIWLAPRWEIRGVGPDLLALVAMAWLAQTGGVRGLVVAALIGLAGDLGSAAPLGIGMAAFALVGYCVIRMRPLLPLDRVPLQWLVVWMGATATTLAQGCMLRLAGQSTVAWRLIAERGLLVGIYTAGVALPVLLVCSWMRDTSETNTLADAIDSLPLTRTEGRAENYLSQPFTRS